MSKLQNIKAVKEMLAGTHKMQSRKTFAMGTTKKEVSEEDIEERFEDGRPKVWIETDPVSGAKTRVTQHDGFKSREPENSILTTIQNALKVPDECPKCGTNMREKEQRLNFKFYHKRGKCFGCVLEEERKIKQQGPEAWKKYQNKIMLANMESWFKDADKEVEILKNQIVRTWQNADGKYGEANMSSFLEKMEEDYLKLKKQLRKQYSE
tara:strand:+ start:220 stop:846 length:627 start_codon:yes stop_codon:yes gene_type:complete